MFLKVFIEPIKKDFYRTDKMDRESLSNRLKHTLSNLGLKLENIRAQCYDGAASMRGSYSGVAKRIKDDNPLALYIHCYTLIFSIYVLLMFVNK